MITHRHIVNGKNRIVLRPFGDLQFGTDGFQEDLWERWVEETVMEKDALAIGLGDYVDSFRPTIRKRLKSAFTDDFSAGAQMDDMLMAQMQNVAKRLQPVKNKIIGLCEGHHMWEMQNGGTSTQYLCQLLKVKYLGFVSAIQIMFRMSTNTARLNIFATHGCGGSKYSYSDASKLERDIMPFYDARIFLRGHSTKVYAIPGSPMWKYTTQTKPDEPLRVYKQNRILVNTGGFMEGYTEGKTSYVEEKGLPSSALGYASLDIKVIRKGGRSKGERPIDFEIKPTVHTQ